MNILITGADGQLGRSFRKYLSLENTKVKYVNREILDITSPIGIDRIMEEFNPDVLINCAAYTAVDLAEQEEEKAFLINEKSVNHIAHTCEKHGSLLIHYSTDYVYHNGMVTPLKENDKISPKGVYAHSKWAGEQKINQSGCDSIIVRTSWVYSEYGSNFMKTMVRIAQDHPVIRVVNDQIGSPTYAKDIVEATAIMIADWRDKNQPKIKETFNFSNVGKISWYDFAVEIFALSHINVKVEAIPSSEYPTAAERPLWSVLDMSKIKNHYDISLRNWKSSLKEAISHL